MIDTDTPESPGWWLERASNELRRRERRLRLLQDRLDGNGPLPHGADGMQEAYRAFQRKSRTNWAERIVEAAAERIELQGFATGVDSDGNGDEVATEQAANAHLFREFPEAIDDMLGLSVGYLVAGSREGRVSVTSESPFNTITFHDPMTDDVRAGVKLFSDSDMGMAFGYLWVHSPDGVRRWIATREVRRTRTNGGAPLFSGATWSWDDQAGGLDGTLIPVSSVPVFRFLNRKGVGDFERHTDLLDRITHQTLQRLVLIATQAYQQRVMIGAPAEDENGKEIDYDGLHVGPGSLWDLPEGVSMWEGKQADLSGVLEASKDDRRELAAVTSTSLAALMPDATNQSAEGAAFSKESLIFRCEKRIKIVRSEVARTYSVIAQLNRDSARSNLSKITPMFADPARRSIAEIADATSKAKDDLPLEERLIRLWGYDPVRAKQLADSKRQEILEAAAYGAASA